MRSSLGSGMTQVSAFRPFLFLLYIIIFPSLALGTHGGHASSPLKALSKNVNVIAPYCLRNSQHPWIYISIQHPRWSRYTLNIENYHSIYTLSSEICQSFPWLQAPATYWMWRLVSLQLAYRDVEKISLRWLLVFLYCKAEVEVIFWKWEHRVGTEMRKAVKYRPIE